MNTVIATILAIISFIGGHFYNRRKDKALFFLGLIVFWIFIVLFISIFSVLRSHAPSINITHICLIWIGIILIWICSVIITIIDSKKPKNNIPPWSIWDKIGVFLLSIFMSIIFLFMLMNYIFRDTYKSRIKESYLKEKSSHFYHTINYGGLSYPYNDLPTPPEGSGKIKGQFIYNNLPVEGIELEVYLNGKYKSNKLITNGEGMFIIKVPYGIWYINRIVTSSWKSIPEPIDFKILSTQEGSLEDYIKTPFYWRGNNGMQLNIVQNESIEPILFTIKKELHIFWPDTRINEKVTDISKSNIHWEEYPQAANYVIWIYEIKRTKMNSTTSYAPVFSKVIYNKTQMPLTELPLVQSNSKTEYQVKIFAFSSDKSLLSDSGSGFEKNVFMLNNYKISENDGRL